MVGSLHPTPIAILPLLAPHSAAAAFCEGILQYGTAWDILRRDELAKASIGLLTLEQARERMRNVLSLTDVTKFPIPKNPKAVIFVAATVSQFLLHFPVRKNLVLLDFSLTDFISILRLGH